MRSAKNFSPEWGYLAPAPSLARTARVVLVATAIGATAGAGVVLSLVERPAEAQKTPIAARAIVTSVRETAVPSVAPTVSTAAVSSSAIAVSAVPAPAPIAASAPPPALKPSASARTAARAMPQAVNPPPAAPPSTVATATSAPVPTASTAPGPSAPAPSASATSLSASNSAPAPATAAITANANVSVAAAIVVRYDCGSGVECGAASGGRGTCGCAREPKYYCAGDAAEKSEAPCVQQRCGRSRTGIDPAAAIRCPFRSVLLSAFGKRRALEPPHPRSATTME